MRPLTALPTLIALSFFLFLYLAPAQQQRHSLHRRVAHASELDYKRAGILGGGDDDSSTTTPASSTTTSSTTTSTTTTSSETSSSTTTTESSTTQSSTAATSTTPSASATTPGSATTPAASNTQPSNSPTPSPSSLTTTNAAGQTVVQIISDTPTASASAASATSSSAGSNKNDDDDDSGVSTSTIVGLSVAGGVAVLGIVAFFIWKFTRKRFHDLDDNEAIKWPELNAHDGATPATRGFDDDGASIRPGGVGGVNNYAASVGATSTTELYPAGADPYAVPPLPQFNPAQPYRDDPNALYDPYGGPNLAAPSTENIPMTQLAGRRSPAPFAGYDQGMGGRASPAPSGMGYGAPPPQQYIGEPGRVLSPAPMQGGYGERARSPGPGMAMGRASPAPQGAGGYGYQ